MNRLAARDLTLSYGNRVVCRDLTIDLPDAAVTAVIGPNGCGKSTLLKALGRVLTPTSGQVLLGGRPASSYKTKEAARIVAMLPQTPVVPEQITVRDLVGRGRFPYHSLLRQWSPDDDEAVHGAMERAGVAGLAARPVAELSGGQRQRVWLAMVVAQRTPVLLLDEPTTYLDVAHQYEVLDLCRDLRDLGITVVAVLHDLNQAARYADQLVVMRAGEVVAQGAPGEVLTAGLVQEVFELASTVIPDPETGTPMVVPHARAGAGPATDRSDAPWAAAPATSPSSR
ncbi:ABC transporter ATP-binding protein [Flexivirga sp. ID2601S]|uniref:ABC transporter ATP-binding protein n=1 Tax=Flexivirga aerilata TaxID=1656889 RepID=A0A849AFA5_9MICO|nr:ABC transporter ATP-binding protein [Flexivirga aerilata]NNG38256.1 ABC transporter ATP-binding protein [Flexivirga aerilata]